MTHKLEERPREIEIKTVKVNVLQRSYKVFLGVLSLSCGANRNFCVCLSLCVILEPRAILVQTSRGFQLPIITLSIQCLLINLKKYAVCICHQPFSHLQTSIQLESLYHVTF